MTNETQEKTQNRGRLLVIDDNPNYALNAVRAARARGYEVDVAFDLKGAMSYLQSGSYTGVITDLQFFEEGIGDIKELRSRFNPLSELEKGLIEPAQTKTEVRADSQLRERIASELATPENASELAIFEGRDGELGRLFFGSLITQQGIQRDNMTHPAMGYEVIRYAQKHNVPLAVVSSVGHGQHCIPALFQTGLARAEDILKHESTRTQIIRDSGKEAYDLPLLHSIVLDRAILVMEDGKEQHTYDFAIDMIEGKIEQTRPYRVEA